MCSEQKIVWEDMGIYFTVELFRIKPPTHLFDEKKIRNVLREGNDFRNNRLVIDENGYANLDDVNQIYMAMLAGWLHHLRSGQNHSIDYYEDNKNEEELVSEIQKLY